MTVYIVVVDDEYDNAVDSTWMKKEDAVARAKEVSKEESCDVIIIPSIVRQFK